MRRHMAVAAGAVVATMALCTPVASAAGDSVTGEALVTGPVLVQADAHSGPAGENPTGTIAVIAGCCTRNPNVGGAVSCLRVDGERAIAGLSREAIDPFTGQPILLATLVEIVDGGSPGVGVDVVTLVGVGVVTAPLASCPATLPSGGTTMVVRPPLGRDESAPFFPDRPLGQDLVVTDGPAPATKKDCMKGGWKRFGFVTKRACLASLKRGPKP
jgi:hypothetical protein